MSKMINFPKKVVTLEQPPIPLLDMVSEVYVSNGEGTMVMIDLALLDKVLKGNISPSILNDDVLRVLLQGSLDGLLKQISSQLDNLF